MESIATPRPVVDYPDAVEDENTEPVADDSEPFGENQVQNEELQQPQPEGQTQDNGSVEPGKSKKAKVNNCDRFLTYARDIFQGRQTEFLAKTTKRTRRT